MKHTFKTLALASLIGGMAATGFGQTTTNILDTFNRNGAFIGSAPDIADTNSAPGSTWSGAFGNQGTTNTGGGALPDSSSWNFAQLNFTPQNGYIYTISVIANIQSVFGDSWAAVGFDNGGQGASWGASGPWMLVKPDGSFQGFYSGTGVTIVSGGAGAANLMGSDNLLQIALDTTSPSSWKAQILINGVKQGSPVALPNGWSVSKVMLADWGWIYMIDRSFSVTSIQPAAPVISGQPPGITNWAGANASMTVAASGSQPMSYQWYKNSIGNPLSGQTAETISFAPLQGTDSGTYFAIITNSYGAVTSSIVNVHAETSTVMALTPSISVGALPGTGTDAGSGLNSASNYLSALDFGSDPTPVTVNGVIFQKIDPTGMQSTNGVDSNYGGSWALTKTTIPASTLAGVSGLANGQADGSMATLLGDAVSLQESVFDLSDSITLNLGGVVPTGKYSLRVYYQNLDSLPLVADFTFNGQGSNEVVRLDEDLGATANSAGAYYVNYNFTAVSNTVAVTLSEAAAARPVYIYGATLQQISAPLVAPSISTQPKGFTNWVGASAVISVSAVGSVPLHYQWYQGTTLLSGQTGNTLNFASLATADSGSYTVVITNLTGSVTSSVANVLVYQGTWPMTPSISLVQIPATGSDSASGIDPTNTYICALDFGSDTTPLAINGVNFTQVSVIGAGSGTINNPKFSGVDANFGGSWSLAAVDTAPDAAGFGSLGVDFAGNVGSQADGNMQAMLTDISYIQGVLNVGNNGKLTLAGLETGGKYSLRYYYRKWSGPRPIDFTFNGQGTNETARVDIDNGGANYVEYDFTAASMSVDVTMAVVTSGSGTHLYGVTLQQTAPGPVTIGISTQPQPVTVNAGGTAQFTVGALGNSLSYQWQRAVVGSGTFSNVGDANASGATTAQLTITNASAANLADYRVIISNGSGSVTSSPPATLNVIFSGLTLMHRWSFSETSGTVANDSIGGANGTLQGSATFTGAGYVQLPNPGSNPQTGNSYVSIPGGLLNSLSAVTVECWVTNNGWNNGNTLVGFSGPIDGNSFGTNYINFYTRMFSSISAFEINTTSGDSGLEALGTRVNDNGVASGIPSHYVYIYDPAVSHSITLYTNGVLAGSQSGVSIPLSSLGTSVGTIGLSVYNQSQSYILPQNGGNKINCPYLNGGVSEVRIYNSGLSSSQIAADYQLGPDQLSQLTTTTNTPTVSVSTGAGSMTLSWPVTSGSFYVESSPVLGAGAVWTMVKGSQTVVGSNYQMVLPTTGATAFFRLRQ